MLVEAQEVLRQSLVLTGQLHGAEWFEVVRAVTNLARAIGLGASRPLGLLSGTQALLAASTRAAIGPAVL
jgi:hypothetical protein